MIDAGGFDHNAHTLRILTCLENPYPDFDGLNLTWETLEGLAKHNGPVSTPSWALAEANAGFDLELDSWPSLEAQVAAIADDIAYDNHDIDDGLRSGILDLGALLQLPFVARLWADIERRHPGLERTRKLKALVRDGIGTMVGDVLDETRRRISESGVETIDEVRAAGTAAGWILGRDAGRRAGAETPPLRPPLRQRGVKADPHRGATDRRRPRQLLPFEPRAFAPGLATR